MIEPNIEDQYVVVSGETSLALLDQALPPALVYRAPRLPLRLEDWLLSGGVGLLSGPNIRSDVLGLTYQGAHGRVSVGGRVVKNVSNLDLVRLIVGSDPSRSGSLIIEQAVLRLRPRQRVFACEAVFRLDGLAAAFELLLKLEAVYGFAYPEGDLWRVRGEWQEAVALPWAEVDAPVPAGVPLRDLHGPWPRQMKPLTPFETTVLAAL